MARDKKSFNLRLIIVLVVVLGGVYVAQLLLNGSNTDTSTAATVTNPMPQGFNIPELNALETAGKAAFEANCQKCHGENALGTNHGPTFIHPFYVPGHHADEAFYRAVSNGVTRHHWNFGNMPRIPDVTGDDVAAIIAYVRALQRANGIQ